MTLKGRTEVRITPQSRLASIPRGEAHPRAWGPASAGPSGPHVTLHGSPALAFLARAQPRRGRGGSLSRPGEGGPSAITTVRSACSVRCSGGGGRRGCAEKQAVGEETILSTMLPFQRE